MPQYHNWNQSITVGNAGRREKDRQRKRQFAGGKYQEYVPSLATYPAIDKHIYQCRNIGGHTVSYFRLCDIARIFNLSSTTVIRWFNLDMLPEPATWEIGGNAGGISYTNDRNSRHHALYAKQQVFVICHVLNDLFEQGYRQYRQSHVHHIDMMRAGSEIAMHRLSLKLSKEPKRPLRILPSPKKSAELRAQMKQPLSYAAYRPKDFKEWLLSL